MINYSLNDDRQVDWLVVQKLYWYLHVRNKKITNGYFIHELIINESNILMLMRQLMPKRYSILRSVARECLTVRQLSSISLGNRDDFDTRANSLKKKTSGEIFIDKITIQFRIRIKNRYDNSCLLCHETVATICKFNSRARRSSYAMMEREQAVAIVFIIIWERERERKREIIISACCIHPRPLFYGSTIPLVFHFYPCVLHYSLPSQKIY